MKVILKPMGLVIVAGAVGLLSFMAFRNTTHANTKTASFSLPALSLNSADTQIYRDGYENGWKLNGWAKEINTNDTSAPDAGTSAIRVRYQPWEGVKFTNENLFNTTQYDRVSFRVYGGKTGGQVLQFGGAYSHAETAPKDSKLVAFKPIPAGKWVTETVSFAEAGLAKRDDVICFWIQEGAGKTQEPVYIDDVRLLRAGEAAP